MTVEEQNDALWERIDIIFSAYGKPEMLIAEEDAKEIDKIIAAEDE